MCSNVLAIIFPSCQAKLELLLRAIAFTMPINVFSSSAHLQTKARKRELERKKERKKRKKERKKKERKKEKKERKKKKREIKKKDRKKKVSNFVHYIIAVHITPTVRMKH